jgi:hypothetical protein
MAQITVLESPETLRRVVSKDGHEQRLTGVKTIDVTGSWTRVDCDQGYAIINNDNVLMFIVKAEKKTF